MCFWVLPFETFVALLFEAQAVQNDFQFQVLIAHPRNVMSLTWNTIIKTNDLLANSIYERD